VPLKSIVVRENVLWGVLFCPLIRRIYMKRIITSVAVAGIITGLLTGCGSSVNTNKVQKVDTKTAQTTMKADAGSVDLKLTETANLKGVLFAVNGVRHVTGNDDTKPAEGKKFVNVDFSLKNTTDAPQYVLPIENLKLKLPDGTAIKAYPVTVDEHGETWAGLNPGSFMQGEFTYEVPASVDEFDVTYSPNINMGTATVHVTGADIK
jgi:hypothetical protein